MKFSPPPSTAWNLPRSAAYNEAFDDQQVKREHTTRSQTFTLLNEGILVVKMHPVSVGLEDLLEVESVVPSLLEKKDELAFSIVDVSSIQHYTSEAREYIKQGFRFPVGACAIVKSSHVSHVLMNFIMLIYHPPYPLKMCNSYRTAFQWVRKMKKRYENRSSSHLGLLD